MTRRYFEIYLLGKETMYCRLSNKSNSFARIGMGLSNVLPRNDGRNRARNLYNWDLNEYEGVFLACCDN